MNHFVTINNKKYPYTLKKASKTSTFVECKDANIHQEFLNEDIPSLLIDLPNLILSEKKYKHAQEQIIRFRINPEDKKKITEKALKKGYTTISGFLRDLAMNA